MGNTISKRTNILVVGIPKDEKAGKTKETIKLQRAREFNIEVWSGDQWTRFITKYGVTVGPQ